MFMEGTKITWRKISHFPPLLLHPTLRISTKDIADLDKSSLDYVNYASISLMCLGGLYSIMGILCMKRLRDDRMAKYIQLMSHIEIQKAISGSRSQMRAGEVGENNL